MFLYNECGNGQCIDDLLGVPSDMMQPIYKWFDNVFGKKPPTKFDKFVDGVGKFGKGFGLIEDKFIPEGKKAFHNAHPAAQVCLITAGAITITPVVEATAIPAIESGYGYVMSNPEIVIYGGELIEALDGYYGGSSPGYNIGSFISGFENFTGINLVPEALRP